MHAIYNREDFPLFIVLFDLNSDAWSFLDLLFDHDCFRIQPLFRVWVKSSSSTYYVILKAGSSAFPFLINKLWAEPPELALPSLTNQITLSLALQKVLIFTQHERAWSQLLDNPRRKDQSCLHLISFLSAVEIRKISEISLLGFKLFGFDRSHSQWTISWPVFQLHWPCLQVRSSFSGFWIANNPTTYYVFLSLSVKDTDEVWVLIIPSLLSITIVTGPSFTNATSIISPNLPSNIFDGS